MHAACLNAAGPSSTCFTGLGSKATEHYQTQGRRDGWPLIPCTSCLAQLSCTAAAWETPPGRPLESCFPRFSWACCRWSIHPEFTVTICDSEYHDEACQGVLAMWVFSSVWSPGVKYLTATPELSVEILPVYQPSSKQQICGFQEICNLSWKKK